MKITDTEEIKRFEKYFNIVLKPKDRLEKTVDNSGQVLYTLYTNDYVINDIGTFVEAFYKYE